MYGRTGAERNIEDSENDDTYRHHLLTTTHKYSREKYQEETGMEILRNDVQIGEKNHSEIEALYKGKHHLKLCIGTLQDGVIRTAPDTAALHSPSCRHLGIWRA